MGDFISTDDTMSYSQIQHIKQLLHVYSDLGVQPHNFSSQGVTISFSDNNAVDGINSFSYNFSQESNHDTSLYESKGSCILQQESTNSNENKIHSKITVQSLVTQQDKWTDCILKSEIRPIASEIEVKNDQQWLRHMHSSITKYKLPNYKGARIPVPSGLNIPMWRYILKDYDLFIIGDYLQFGFPINVDFNIFQCNTQVVNHSSAWQRKQGVHKYFTTEVSKKAMLGPFENFPFDKVHYLPLMARDKPDGGVCVIVDLSWPVHKSVNSYIPDNVFDEMNFVLKYPTIDMVIEIGPKALLYKIDLERPFRNLRVDPSAYPLLCLKWNDVTYMDVNIAFGIKIGAAAC